MTIKLGKSAIGTYVRSGRSDATERKVLDFLPAGTLRGSRDDWGWFFERPLSKPSYVLDYPSDYKRVSTKTYIKYARAAQTETT